MSNQIFDKQSRYILKDYDRLKPFTNFLPGIAGLNGIPMWVFYVNRGQAISSFGTASKDHAIMEFQPANKAYRLTALYGFRTFIKVHHQAGNNFYEPFSDIATARSVSRTMYIGMDEFEIEEIDQQAGFQVNVLYYTVPQADYAALVRKLTLKNLSSQPITLEVLDGAPVIIPFGVNGFAQKQMSRTAEAWMEVFNLENNAPYFKVRASMDDTAQVDTVEAGHFAVSFLTHLQKTSFPKPIVDPTVIFGPQQSFLHPVNFVDSPLADIYTSPQRTLGQTPCAFFGEALELQPEAEFTLSSLFGRADTKDNLEKIQEQITAEYLDKKLAEGREISKKITQPIEGKTARPIFDEYAKQTFLDNVLRGGLPEQLAPGGPTYHVFSRKHGDPERDYNYFYLAPEYYSHGNGNYRDVNQNRRSDVLFYPEVGDYNLRFFLSLIQLDGYNPLVIQGTQFVLEPEAIKSIVSKINLEGLAEFLSKPFTPGGLLHLLYSQSDEFSISHDEIFEVVFLKAGRIIDAIHGEGFWVDHWTYNLDLLDSFLAVYPDRKTEMLFAERDIPWYEGPARVLPRQNRYKLTENGLRQYAGVVVDEEKSEALKKRGVGQTWVQISNSGRKIYTSTIFEKLFILLVIKTATLDPAGMGVEMEAGKPGWYDALNGLPGLLGSSVGETYEIARLAEFLKNSIDEVDNYNIRLPVEFYTFLDGLINLLDKPQEDALEVWRQTSVLRETYRESIFDGITGRDEICSMEQVKSYLEKLSVFISGTINRIELTNPNIPPTYYYYEATNLADEDKITPTSLQIEVNQLEFQQHRMPDFLEGCVHAMRVSNQAKVREIYRAVRASGLFDKKLGMYKVNTSLASVTHEVGRTTAFPPGWLENESVWLHMEYKYLLEILRAGLYSEFYQDIQTALVPFLPVERYGRSPLENSSFIASSAYPDSSLHGTGFVARLSGSTAEFLSIWFEMFAGQNPFTVKDGKLTLQLKPRLAHWLFSETGKVEFIFLGHTRVVYENPQILDTWRAKIKSIELVFKDGRKIKLDREVIPDPYALDVREGKVKEIMLHLGENRSG